MNVNSGIVKTKERHLSKNEKFKLNLAGKKSGSGEFLFVPTKLFRVYCFSCENRVKIP